MEAATHAEAQEAWQREQLEAQARTRREDLGFWLCIPPGLAAITRAFLRGDGVEIPAASTPTSDVPEGLTPRTVAEIQEQTASERGERASRRWK